MEGNLATATLIRSAVVVGGASEREHVAINGALRSGSVASLSSISLQKRVTLKT